MVFGRDLRQLYLKKRFTGYQVHTMEEGELQRIETEIISQTPFGVEDYYGRRIVNIVLPEEIDDQIAEIDNLFANLSPEKLAHFLPNGLERKLSGKRYQSMVKREDGRPPLLRTYASTTSKSKDEMVVTREKQPYDGEIAKMPGRFHVVLVSMWVSYQRYGLTWVLKSVDLD